MVGGEKKRREEKEGEEEQRRGRVGEEDRAGGEGESEDSFADNHTLKIHLRKRVSKMNEITEMHSWSDRLKALEKFRCCNRKLGSGGFVNSMNSVHSGERKKTRVCLLRIRMAVFTSTAIDCNLRLFKPLNILPRICPICLGSIRCLFLVLCLALAVL